MGKNRPCRIFYRVLLVTLKLHSNSIIRFSPWDSLFFKTVPKSYQTKVALMSQSSSKMMRVITANNSLWSPFGTTKPIFHWLKLSVKVYTKIQYLISWVPISRSALRWGIFCPSDPKKYELEKCIFYLKKSIRILKFWGR